VESKTVEPSGCGTTRRPNRLPPNTPKSLAWHKLASAKILIVLKLSLGNEHSHIFFVLAIQICTLAKIFMKASPSKVKYTTKLARHPKLSFYYLTQDLPLQKGRIKK
jgi:hypothetical protein